ncbi:cyclic nucleotide-binding domain-containing protein [Flavobacteriaceae bacterium Ap0902]|nr:cyclic nucleotide-binding domain-containing protein [Flavobacteriaceae bacterium Ap0902]
MILEEDILAAGGELVTYKKGEVIFSQLDWPRYFFQIKSGAVAMNTLNEDGKEFTQGVFSRKGDSFGEPPLFIDKNYPSTAKVLEDSKIYQLPKENFIQLLIEKPAYSLALNKKLSKMLYFKSKMSTEISLYDPEHRILTLFDFIKSKSGSTGKHEKIDLTRQQIANLTALRVETVIRAIKSLEEKGELQIKNRKVYY